ncbi:MtN3-like protein [Phytophthora megakarya]|uniref:Sugar transporter SWEET1 n=1 Tax=Phytophthora megakarya TaxID=4795 RepID=A0A225VCV4_9STRA|nr:MtN3-like protein [Phytophthora megakarya]
MKGAIPFVLVTGYAILVAVKVINQPRSQFGDILGYLANVATFALFMSPFEKIKLVFQTKSSAAIPVLLCAIIFANSSLWLINGIVDDDLFIVVPNVVGVSLTVAQLSLFYIYRPSRNNSSVYRDDDEIDVVVNLEMGTTVKVWTSNSPTFAALTSPKTPTKY